MASPFRSSPQRPTVQIPQSAEPEAGREETMNDEEETVESVMAKLGIERRVQYGAEKMLDVIEQQQSGLETGGMKDKITAQLESAANKIRELEEKLERLRGATPLRSRMRPQARLHGFSSNSSLSVNQLSASTSSSTLLTCGRPHVSRQTSRGTPDRERLDVFPNMIPLPTTPSRAGSHNLMPGSSHSQRPRSMSIGADSLGSPRQGDGIGSSRMGWMPSATSPGEIPEEAHNAGMIENAVALINRLRDLGRRMTGKGKEVDMGDEPWQCMTKLAGILKKAPSIRVLLSTEDIIDGTLRFLGDAVMPRTRAAAYRLLRYVLDRQLWGIMLESGIEWLFIRTFTRDAKCVHEREQALRLIRAVIVLPAPPPPSRPASRRRRRSSHSRPRSSQSRQATTPAQESISIFVAILTQRVPLTDGILRSLVSVAENQDDALRTICMQTLVEIGLLDIDRLMQTDAFRIVLSVLKDGPSELGPSVSALLAFLTNFPHTRHRLVPGSDVESAFVGFTEDQAKPSTRQPGKQLETIDANVKNIIILLNTWSGLLYLCMDGRRAITSLVSSLLVPNDEMRDALLNLLFTIFKIKLPTWKDAFLDGKRLTVYNRAQEAVSSTLNEEAGEVEAPDSLNLIDQYVALLMATFIDAGLLDALIRLVGENVNALNRKATLLLGEMLQKANRILPLPYAAQMQALPKLFAESMDFKSPIKRSSALSALSSIGSLTRNRKKATSTLLTRKTSLNRHDPLDRGQMLIQQAKLRQGLALDDRQFIQMINDSGIILNRDHTKWNYEMIVDLLEGPLMNPKRLDEAIKATKFVRRLLAFFHPLNGRFSLIRRSRPTQKWVTLGCTLLNTMLSCPEGIRYLTEDKLVSQMAACFSDIDEQSGRPSAHPIFSRDRIDRTLTHGYFEMLGTMTKSREGLALLDKFRFFSSIYHLTDQPAREQIVRYAIECFDYTLDGHPRLVLSRALTTTSLPTRLFATHQLGRLLQTTPVLDDWGLQLMITQLYDTAIEICDLAVMYLEEVCTDETKLQKVVAMRPALEHLGDIGHPLFMRFVSTSIGFEYLQDAQYIDREMDIWLTDKNLLYVVEVETWVSQTLRPFTSDTIEDYWTYDGTAPSHFFGELTKTPEGCDYLREQNVVRPLAAIVRQHGLESKDQTVLTSLKCALWALGNIGSTDGGVKFLEEEEIIEAIVEVAEQSPVLSIRGTGFFVLGLLSAGRRGAEMLEECGWISTRTAMGATTGLVLPTSLDRFSRIQPWKRADTSLPSLPLPKLTGLEGEIMTSIANLSNYVLAASAMNNLKRVRNRHSRYFSSMTLFHRALRIISTNHYPAPVRRFIIDLFDIQLNHETLVQLRHIELSSFTLPVPLAHLHEHDDEHHINPRNEDPTRDDYEYDAYHQTGRQRRRSASYPGPQRPAQARKRGLTISDIPNSAGESSHDDGDYTEGESERHSAREKVQGFGHEEKRYSGTNSRSSSRPMSRRTSQSSSRLLDMGAVNETLG